jgi:ArsR family transcriptional regulator, lead/cadmium/zinc/bismuth-responsive transcriptional repressor
MTPSQSPEKPRRMKPDETMRRLAETFKVLGDTTRTKMVYLLTGRELSVSRLAELAGISQSSASHNLRILRSMELVKVRRAGKNSFYVLDDDHIHHLIDEGLKHVEE